MKAKFFMADDIRQEASGKFTIIGLYADDVMILNAPAGTPAPTRELTITLPRKICFLVNLSDIDTGKYPASAEIVPPDGGEPQVTVSIPEGIVVDENRSANIISEVDFFPISGNGIYNWRMKIGEFEALDIPFELRLNIHSPPHP